MAATTFEARRTRARTGRASKPPLEYSLLSTATLCLMAFGAVMVYSASSAESLLGGSGDPSFYFKRYLMFGIVGLALLWAASRIDLKAVRAITPVLLLVSFGLTAALMIPGIGVNINGATRWIAAGPLQFQPSELLKLAVMLYAARLLASRPRALRSLGGLVRPLLLVVAASALLLLAQPDMGTAMVICFAVGGLLIAAGARMRDLGTVVAAALALGMLVILVEPYRRERLLSFLDPWASPEGSGFQIVQSMIAIGSGGLFGNGLGESVQKVFYLPEAHTDMILAIIGEEIGVFGIVLVVALYGLIAYAGLRTAKLARDRYSKLLAVSITSLIVCQASLNLFAVMGMAPLTGVPLPFMSYGLSNLLVLLLGMGLLMNVASSRGVASESAKRPPLSVVRGVGESHGESGRHRSGGNGRPRGSGARRGRRAAG